MSSSIDFISSAISDISFRACTLSSLVSGWNLKNSYTDLIEKESRDMWFAAFPAKAVSIIIWVRNSSSKLTWDSMFVWNSMVASIRKGWNVWELVSMVFICSSK
jgi:hypothetical protein